MNDKREIQKLLEKWAYNTKIGAQEKILDNHSESVVIYDVWPPIRKKNRID